MRRTMTTGLLAGTMLVLGALAPQPAAATASACGDDDIYTDYNDCLMSAKTTLGKFICDWEFFAAYIECCLPE